MKLLKSYASIKAKEHNGVPPTELAASYEQYQYILPNPTGKQGDHVKINDQDYYCWVFYEEDVANPTNPGNKKKFHFVTEEQQERYEWFCAGWVLFYDEIIRPKATTSDIKQQHKLLFFWDRMDVPGVAIYINDALAIKNFDKDIVLAYTPATATGDPPTPPPPPPPSSL